MTENLPVIAVLGASGLIGQAIASGLMQQGFVVVPVARRLTRAQKAAFGDAAVERPILALTADDWSRFLDERRVAIVVNCLGVLQDGPRGRTEDVHQTLVARLLEGFSGRQEPGLLVHLSIPGREDEDQTPFSRTKRAAERLIMAGTVPHVILRPGFVVGQAAYGGSALIRGLAALPVDLPKTDADRAFAATDMADIVATITFVATNWRDGARDWAVRWDMMAREPTSLGSVVDAFRRRFGGPRRRLRLPSWLMDVGAKAADLSAVLGWTPPIRGTALRELRRGVAGDPKPWIAATGIEPGTLEATLARLPATVQEAWFARLYLLKSLVLATLAVFWVLSGLIALTLAFEAASAILVAHGFPKILAPVATVVTSLADIAVGCAIAIRRTCRAGLWGGVALSLVYMASAALITPELWIDPVGALVKTGPAIVLMLVALAIFEDR